MKRPSFQFYPGDWLTDMALRSCSIQARGLWIDMICHMHQGTPYGYLKVNHKVIHAPNLARMVGLTTDEVEGCIKELIDAGVCQVDDEGCFFSKRMIRDENLRQIRAAGGKKGGNPVLKDKKNPDGRLTSEVKQKPTPSSSSSSSSIERREENPPLPPTPISRNAELAILLREQGVNITPANPHLCQWVNSEITDLEASEAIARARVYKPGKEPIAPGYIAKIIADVISERDARQEKTPEAAKPLPGLGASTSTPKRGNYGRPTIEEQNRAAAAEAKRRLFGDTECIEGEVIRG